jgi:hypothetical protein
MVRPRALKALTGAVDACRLIGPQESGAVELSWPLAVEDLRRVEVLWPRRYEWPNAVAWVGPLRGGIACHARVIEADIPQRHKGIVVFRVKIDGDLHDVALDYSDYPEYDQVLLDTVPLYLKMQCPIGADARVLPGGFGPRSRQIYRYLKRLRRIRAKADFKFDVYGRFGADRAQRIRSQAVAMLSSQHRIAYEGGLKLRAYPSYLREIAYARLCLDLPGNGALCFRRFDYLSVGSCVIGPRPMARLPVAPIDSQDVVYCSDDLSDLVDLCEHYIADHAAREAIAANARAYFDRFLHPRQLGAYYLRTALRALGAPQREEPVG